MSESVVAKDITLGELLLSLYAARWFLLSGAIFGILFSAVFLALVTPLYKAEMIVAPADGYGLGDYASSVPYEKMVSLPFWRPTDPKGISTDFYRFIHTARGASVAGILLKDKTVLAGIGEDERYTGKVDNWTAEELSKYLYRNVRIEHLGATPLRRLVYYHPDREFAVALLHKIHLVADQLIRRDRRRQSQKRIEYLQQALEKARNPEHRKGITSLLLQQEHIKMLADMNESYSAIVVEPAYSGPEYEWPKPFIVFSAFVFSGMMIGYALWSLLRIAKYR